MLYGIKPALILLLSAQTLVPNMAAAERLLINLREDVSVVSSRVLLRDVADLRGADARQVEKLSQILIIESPVFGETAVIDSHKIGELVQAEAGPLPAGTFAGASVVRIRVQGRQITADEIKLILKSHIHQTTSWKESEITIRSIGSLNGMELPSTGAEFRISASEAVIGGRNVLVPLEIVQDGKILRSYWVTAEIGIRAEVMTAARRITPGKAVTLDDIEKKMAEIPDMRVSYARDPEDVLGKESRRGFLPGGLLPREVFADPLLIRSGETVQLRLERDGITLTSLVKAQQDGRLGQFIRVRSVDFSTLLKAQVSGRSEVRMQ